MDPQLLNFQGDLSLRKLSNNPSFSARGLEFQGWLVAVQEETGATLILWASGCMHFVNGSVASQPAPKSFAVFLRVLGRLLKRECKV